MHTVEGGCGRQAGPQSGLHDQAPGRVWGGGVSVGGIGGDPLLKLEISSGVNVVPLLLDSKVGWSSAGQMCRKEGARPSTPITIPQPQALHAAFPAE